jgi:hypothetical protein
MSKSTAPTDVHVVLNDGSPNHSGTSKHEPGSDTLNGREFDSTFAKHRVHDEVHERHRDHDGKWLQIL